MAKCGACGKFVAAAEGVKCSKCSTLYDRLCVALPGTGRVNSAWVCPTCTSKMPRDNSADTPVKGMPSKADSAGEKSSLATSESHSSDDALDLALQMKLLRKELVEFRKEMAKVQTGISACENRLDKLESRVAQIECNGVQPIETYQAQTADLAATVSKLQAELNDRDQELLQNDVEIANLPEEMGENPSHLVTLIATKLGMALEERDIVCAVRTGARRSSMEGHSSGAGDTVRQRPRTLVVRFTRRMLRDEFLRSARVRRGATTADMGLKHEPCRFYINERLTRYNKLLFYKAREEGRQNKWKFVWTREGRIYARQDQGMTAHRIRTDLELENIFRTAMVYTQSK